MHADAVLAECAANPDDDAPRLVWADLVGGERGELVVVQCEIARGNATPELRARERELLDAHGVAWAGELAEHAWRWSFRRGFIEAAVLKPSAPLAWPLLSSITLDDGGTGALARLVEVPGLRALGIGATRLVDLALERFTSLRGLALTNATGSVFDNVQRLVTRCPIEHLRLRDVTAPVWQVANLLASATRVTALEISSTITPSVVELAFERPLRALRLGQVRYRELAMLANSTAGSTVERLSFDLVGEAPLLDDVLAALPKLRVVERRGEYGGHDELLHESPDAMIALGPPCFERSLPACIVRLDGGIRVSEIAPHASDTPLYIGQSGAAHVVIYSKSVADRHAVLVWRDGAHVLRDVRPTGGDRVRFDPVVLHDGDVFTIGDVRLQYFVGPDCRERARRA